MINYVINFDEIEDSLKSILSNINLKSKKEEATIDYEKTTFMIPPIKGTYSKILDNPGGLIELSFDINGFSPEDRLEIFFDGEKKGELNFCYSNRIIRFAPFSGEISLNYISAGGYKNIQIYSLFYTTL